MFIPLAPFNPLGPLRPFNPTRPGGPGSPCERLEYNIRFFWNSIYYHSLPYHSTQHSHYLFNLSPLKHVANRKRIHSKLHCCDFPIKLFRRKSTLFHYLEGQVGQVGQVGPDRHAHLEHQEYLHYLKSPETLANLERKNAAEIRAICKITGKRTSTIAALQSQLKTITHMLYPTMWNALNVPQTACAAQSRPL